jgi:hypothetical protein
MDVTVFEIVPDRRDVWVLKPCHGAPYGLRYRELWQAISYAEWVARDFENAEIRVYNRDGTLKERQVLKLSVLSNCA